MDRQGKEGMACTELLTFTERLTFHCKHLVDRHSVREDDGGSERAVRNAAELPMLRRERTNPTELVRAGAAGTKVNQTEGLCDRHKKRHGRLLLVSQANVDDVGNQPWRRGTRKLVPQPLVHQPPPAK